MRFIAEFTGVNPRQYEIYLRKNHASFQLELLFFLAPRVRVTVRVPDVTRQMRE